MGACLLVVRTVGRSPPQPGLWAPQQPPFHMVCQSVAYNQSLRALAQSGESKRGAQLVAVAPEEMGSPGCGEGLARLGAGLYLNKRSSDSYSQADQDGMEGLQGPVQFRSFRHRNSHGCLVHPLSSPPQKPDIPQTAWRILPSAPGFQLHGPLLQHPLKGGRVEM